MISSLNCKILFYRTQVSQVTVKLQGRNDLAVLICLILMARVFPTCFPSLKTDCGFGDTEEQKRTQKVGLITTETLDSPVILLKMFCG